MNGDLRRLLLLSVSTRRPSFWEFIFPYRGVHKTLLFYTGWERSRRILGWIWMAFAKIGRLMHLPLFLSDKSYFRC
ncbi:hypothetical protein HanRHA438_Chr11g0519611 [Helianthus annuus]|nr:hypothetical protein HanRHA438_Chr11g0519611 [Helianthus annuus]